MHHSEIDRYIDNISLSIYVYMYKYTCFSCWKMTNFIYKWEVQIELRKMPFSPIRLRSILKFMISMLARVWENKQEIIPWRRAWQPTPVFLPGESPWTEEPGGLQTMGLQKVEHGWVTRHTHCIAKEDTETFK